MFIEGPAQCPFSTVSAFASACVLDLLRSSKTEPTFRCLPQCSLNPWLFCDVRWCKVVTDYRRLGTVFIHSFSILSDDRSKASSKTMPPGMTSRSKIAPFNWECIGVLNGDRSRENPACHMVYRVQVLWNCSAQCPVYVRKETCSAKQVHLFRQCKEPRILLQQKSLRNSKEDGECKELGNTLDNAKKPWLYI